MNQTNRDNDEPQRPWGRYEVLSDEPDHKVKRITVIPGARLSLQRHRRRSEHWHVIRGEAVVTLGQQEMTLVAGESVDIPKGGLHRVANPGRRIWYLSRCSAVITSARTTSSAWRTTTGDRNNSNP